LFAAATVANDLASEGTQGEPTLAVLPSLTLKISLLLLLLLPMVDRKRVMGFDDDGDGDDDPVSLEHKL